MFKVSSATSIDWGWVGSNWCIDWCIGMYKRLIFRYKVIRVITVLMTKFVLLSLLYVGLSDKSFRKLRWVTNAIGRKTESQKECVSGKSQCRSLLFFRTVNRHRWTGREYQGRRVRLVQGTRQKSERKFYDMLCHLRMAATNVYQPTVYQKHRLLQIRKWDV